MGGAARQTRERRATPWPAAAAAAHTWSRSPCGAVGRRQAGAAPLAGRLFALLGRPGLARLKKVGELLHFFAPLPPRCASPTDTSAMPPMGLHQTLHTKQTPSHGVEQHAPHDAEKREALRIGGYVCTPGFANISESYKPAT